jgi:hypothetical protein
MRHSVPWQRRLLDHHEPRPLQVPNQALRGDAGHQLIGVMDSPAPVISERKGERLLEFLGAGRSDAGFIGHEIG